MDKALAMELQNPGKTQAGMEAPAIAELKRQRQGVLWEAVKSE